MSDADYWEKDLDERRLSANVRAADLDPHQRAFCESSPADNIRVLAPAGSGKTQTLLWRCLTVHERAGNFPRFLIVTFTVAARAELEKRLQDPAFKPLQQERVVTVSTLNSYGWKLVRDRRKRTDGPLGLVMSRREKADCVAQVDLSRRRHSAVASVLRKRPALAAGLMDHVDTLKNLGFRLEPDWSEEKFLSHCGELQAGGLGPQLDRLISELRKLDILPDPDREAIERRLGIGSVDGKEGADPRATLYENFWPFAFDLFVTMYERNQCTVDDQKYRALLQVEEELRSERTAPGGQRLSHVLVDEFQDISPLDLSLVRAIADWHDAALTIVGDDDQAIYEWRGGSPTFLLNPEKEFGRRFETFLLERNYRCPRNLVSAADALIRNNRHRYEKRIEPMKKDDANVVLLDSASPEAAVDRVMTEVRAFLRRRGERDRMALLSRKKAQLVPFQILFADEEIEFEAADDLRIFLSRAFQSLIAMVEIRARRDHSVPAQQIVADIVRLCKQVTAGHRDRRFIEAIQRDFLRRSPSSYGRAHEVLRELQRATGRSDDPSSEIPDYANAVFALFASKTVAAAVAAIGARFEGLAQDFGRGARDIFFQDPPFFYLKAVAERFASDFPGFLRSLARASESAKRQSGERDAANAGDDRVYQKIELATALRAKGKEFHTVAILDANAGVWLSVLAETDAELEAERRLFYVAMTRAQQKLIVSFSRVDTDGRRVASSPYISEAGLEEVAAKSKLRSSQERGTSVSENPGRARATSTRGTSPPPNALRLLEGRALAEVVGAGENYRLEFKSTLRRNVKTGRKDRRMSHGVLKTLAGFMNTDGGTLVIGVDDDGRPLPDLLKADGFANGDSVLRHLMDMVSDRLGVAASTLVQADFKDYKNRRVLVVSCNRSTDPVWLRESNADLFFVRSGPTTRQIPQSEVAAYLGARRSEHVR